MVPHAFAHCDSTNAFKGIWKIKPIKAMQANQILHPVLARVGETWEVANYLLAGFDASTNVYLKWQHEQQTKTLILVGCHLAKRPSKYIRRDNYQMIIWRKANTVVVGFFLLLMVMYGLWKMD